MVQLKACCTANSFICVKLGTSRTRGSIAVFAKSVFQFFYFLKGYILTGNQCHLKIIDLEFHCF
uniref:Uncharacterized protein n=1 Tax=Anguilla anguilla TaxID=7936 RepID=A0A0E9TMV0_ANGAN